MPSRPLGSLHCPQLHIVSFHNTCREPFILQYFASRPHFVALITSFLACEMSKISHSIILFQGCEASFDLLTTNPKPHNCRTRRFQGPSTVAWGQFIVQFEWSPLFPSNKCRILCDYHWCWWDSIPRFNILLAQIHTGIYHNLLFSKKKNHPHHLHINQSNLSLLCKSIHAISHDYLFLLSTIFHLRHLLHHASSRARHLQPCKHASLALAHHQAPKITHLGQY